MGLRLAVERVPGPIQYANLRNAVRPATWDRLRRRVYDAAGRRCQACDARGRLQCHERWQYDYKAGTARLKGLRALCGACHAVCHPGAFFARMLERGGVYSVSGERGLRAMDPKTGFTPEAHWCKVNGLDRAAWERHLKATGAPPEKRCRRRWRVDLGRWADLVPAERRRGRLLLPAWIKVMQDRAEQDRAKRMKRAARRPGVEKRKGKRN